MAKPSVIVLGNCTHYALKTALAVSDAFETVASAELYSLPEDARETLATELATYDYILTLQHGSHFGPVATGALKKRYLDKVVSVPTPFFSGTMPDMAYLLYDGSIARAQTVLGDYHSALLMAESADDLSRDMIVQRYVSGQAFDRLDVAQIWQDNLCELGERDKKADIALVPFIKETSQTGAIASGFLSFNHPTEHLITYVARQFMTRIAVGDPQRARLSADQHNLYADAHWPLHPVVAERLKLPQASNPTFKTPDRMGGERLSVAEFARRSVDSFRDGKALEQFSISTPAFLSKRIGAAQPMPQLQSTTAPQRQLVLTHFGRSGSTVLAKQLEQHSQITWLNEFFSLIWIQKRFVAEYNFSTPTLVDMLSAEVDCIRAKAPQQVVGHEIKLMNFLQNPSSNMVDYVRAVSDPTRFAHVVLRRRNVLKRICSTLKAAQTQTYHVVDSAQAKRQFHIDFCKPLVDYDTGQTAETFPDLIRLAKQREDQVIANYRKLGIPFLELTYEDDIEIDPRQAYRKVLNWYGLPDETAKVELKKTSHGLAEDIENYDALAASMSDSPYAWMLD